MKTESFTVDVGNVRIPVYFTPARVKRGRRRTTYPSWTVVWRMDGRRQTQRFTSPARAAVLARSKATALANGEGQAARLTSADAAAYARARELLGPSGKSIELAIAEYAAAVEDLGQGVSLAEAVQFYRRRNVSQASTITVAAAVADCLAAKSSQGKSDRYVQDLDSRLGRFASAFQVPLATVAGQDIDAWLRSLQTDAENPVPLSLRSRNNYRSALQALFRWAIAARLLPRDWAELEAVGFTKAPPGKIHVLTPEAMSRLLQAALNAPQQLAAHRAMVPWLAIRGFAGVREAEAGRLTWERHVHLDSGYLELSPDVTKTAARRLVPIQSGLRTWLEAWPERRGPVATVGNPVNAYLEIARAAQVPTAHNMLRDSFISYRLAVTQNKSRTAEEAGNSPRKIDESYREIRTANGRLITPELGAKWFGICCKSVAKNLLRVNFRGKSG